MIRVLIADDESLARERISTLLLKEQDIEMIGESRNGPQTLEMIRKLKPDLVFLDIQMPGYNGLEVLEQLSETELPEVVFVTAYDQYTLQAFAAHAIDYLLKPFDNERFREMLDYARKRLSDHRNSRLMHIQITEILNALSPTDKESAYLKRIPLRQGQSIRFLEVSELISCEAEGSYVRLFTDTEQHMIRENLGQLEKNLDPKEFFRIHRSTLVRISAIRELQSWTAHEWMAVLKNGKKYIVSRAHRDKLKEVLRL